MTGTQEIYRKVDELISSLRSAGQSRLGDMLHHRLHVAAWTTSSELLEELQIVLSGALKEEGATSTLELRNQIAQIQIQIKTVLK
jgi:hypothetical protein